MIRKLIAEWIGSALLIATVVGSGIAATQLSPTDGGLQLLENAIATGAVLVALIATLGPVSGAHFNPVVTLIDRHFGGLTNREAVGYIAAQVSGAVVGAVVANAMFARPVFELATKERGSGPLWFAEVIATFGLVVVIFGLARAGRAIVIPFAVGCYITGAYFFTSSTSFANPAVTFGRMFSDSFAGIAPGSTPGFVIAQLIGGVLGFLAIRVLYPPLPAHAETVVVPHTQGEDSRV